MTIIATVTVCAQVGESTIIEKHISRAYEENRTIGEILGWARAITGKESVSICEIRLSDYTGSSF